MSHDKVCYLLNGLASQDCARWVVRVAEENGLCLRRYVTLEIGGRDRNGGDPSMDGQPQNDGEGDEERKKLSE